MNKWGNVQSYICFISTTLPLPLICLPPQPTVLDPYRALYLYLYLPLFFSSVLPVVKPNLCTVHCTHPPLLFPPPKPCLFSLSSYPSPKPGRGSEERFKLLQCRHHLWHHRRCWWSASNSAWLARHECRFRHRRPRHPPASVEDVVRYTGTGTSVAHLLSNRKNAGCVLRWPNVPTVPAIVVVCFRVRSSDPSYSFCIRQTSSESPWDVEFESTYTFMSTTPRSTSVAPLRIVNPLPIACWPAYRKFNRGWAQIVV